MSETRNILRGRCLPVPTFTKGNAPERTNAFSVLTEMWSHSAALRGAIRFSMALTVSARRCGAHASPVKSREFELFEVHLKHVPNHDERGILRRRQLPRSIV